MVLNVVVNVSYETTTKTVDVNVEFSSDGDDLSSITPISEGKSSQPVDGNAAQGELSGVCNVNSTFEVVQPCPALPTLALPAIPVQGSLDVSHPPTVHITLNIPQQYFNSDIGRIALQFGDIFEEIHAKKGLTIDIEKAILFRWWAVNITREKGLAFYSLALCGLGITLDKRGRGSLKQDDLLESLRLLRLALECCDNSQRLDCLGALANALAYGYKQFGSAHDLDESLALIQGFVDDLGESDHQRPHILATFAFVLLSRFQERGIIADLERAIKAEKEALELIAEDDPERFVFMNDLAGSLMRRSVQFSSDDNLDDAIQLYRDALKYTPDGTNISTGYYSLAVAIQKRYDRSGVMDDLNDAIRYHREALNRRGSSHPGRFSSLNMLADCLAARAVKLRLIYDIDEAIRYHREGLHLLPPNHPSRAILLCNFAQTLRTRRALDAKDRQCIDQAITISLEALDVFGPTHARRHMALFELAYSLSLRFSDTGDVTDATKALEYMKEAVNALDPHYGHSERAAYLCALAKLYLQKKAPYYSVSTALPYVGAAIDDKFCNAQLRLKYVLSVFNMGIDMVEQTRPLLLDTYEKAVHLLPQVAYFGLDLKSRLSVLKDGEGLSNAAAAIACLGKLSNKAVEIVEEGRSVFWSQALRLRSSFVGLPSDLAEQLSTLARELEIGSYSSKGSTKSTSEEELEKEAARRRRLSEQFDRLVLQIRNIPRYNNFLLPDTIQKLSKAALGGPVVVLIPSHMYSFALIVKAIDFGGTFHTHDVIQIYLPKATPDWLARMASSLRGEITKGSVSTDKEDATIKESNEEIEDTTRSGRRRRGLTVTDAILKELWENVVQKVMENLPECEPSPKRRRKRLWWCPAGDFAFLPLHAAGSYADGGGSCADYVVSSYTPTLNALFKARLVPQRYFRDKVKVLLAAVPQGFRGDSLPGAAKEMERVKKIVPQDSLISLPPEDDTMADTTRMAGATVKSIVDRLKDATILHLACHGEQDSNNPLNSGFIMRDEMLTISKIMPIPLSRAFFAFLSACETAKGDMAQSDQAIHIAAAMLFTGFKSIVATMWVMGDNDGAKVAEAVYKALFEGEVLDPNCIPYALDEAVQAMRKEGVPATKWAPFIHIGI